MAKHSMRLRNCTLIVLDVHQAHRRQHQVEGTAAYLFQVARVCTDEPDVKAVRHCPLPRHLDKPLTAIEAYDRCTATGEFASISAITTTEIEDLLPAHIFPEQLEGERHQEFVSVVVRIGMRNPIVCDTFP